MAPAAPGSAGRWFQILSCYAFLMAGHAALHLIRGDWPTVRDDLALFKTLSSDRAAVRKTRRLLAPLRRRSDRDLFRRVVKSRPRPTGMHRSGCITKFS